ncbi:MAG: PilT/PilU family type 4a pilus ATPase [Coriobacteriia bacterium]|nr:PilT/PilU family type 4a pilus ATPase [Coriobacteriia bacterium]
MAEKVLVVHEDAEFVTRLKGALALVSSEVQLANALSAIRAEGMLAQELPDVIIIDAGLADRDGFELTRGIKGVAATKDVPIVLVCAAVDEATALKARASGAAALLPSAGADDQLARKVVSLARGGAAPAPAGQPAAAPQVMEVPAEVAAAGLRVPGVSSTPAQQVSEPVGVAENYGAPMPVMPVDASQTGPVPAGPAPARPSAGVITGEGAAPGSGTPHIDDLLRLMLDRGGSDLHLTVGSPPGIRQRGEIIPVENMKPLSPRDTMDMLLSLLSEEQRRRFETELELDFAYSIPGVSRFRANIFQQRNSMGAVFRVIPIKIPTLEELGLPPVCRFLADRPRGLVLVTGPTGSGKSTTLAAMVDHINATRPVHIITLEDPIEFMHRNKQAYVNQREIGEDTHSFSSALRRVLRQDPDVILVGEMRDLETISAAITAAETGHLVLATLHTTGGPETIDRIIDVFPPHQQQQVRMQLSTTLEGVLSQVLLRSTDGRSRIMAMEIMLGVPAISNLIREGKTHQMETIIQGSAALGMQTLDQALKNLMNGGKVAFDEAIGKSKNPRELAAMVGRTL